MSKIPQQILMFTKRPINFFCFVALICFSINIQAQHWIQSGGGLTVDEGNSIVVDGSGNTYATGYFTGSVSFGNNSLTSAGSTDIFVVKIDNQGNYVWAKKLGGSGSDRGLSIDIDSQGNCYITGYFYGTANFDSFTLTSAGNQDIFIAKLNSSGSVTWVQSHGGTNADIGNSIHIDNNNNALITGEFIGSSTIGGATYSTSGSDPDAFILKIDSAGNSLWTKHGSGGLTIKGIDVTTDNQGNVYATGQYSGDLTFDFLHTNTMFNAIFVVKFNSAGQETWFRTIGAANANFVTGIDADQAGNIYLSGSFTGSLTFFAGSGNSVLSSSFLNNAFIAKYSSSGMLSWSKSAGSNSYISCNDISVSTQGEVYIIGEFECKLDEYADIYGQGVFNSVGFKDIYVSKYTSVGTHSYSKHIGSRQEDNGRGISSSTTGQIHVTGSYKSDLFVPTSANFVTSNLSNWSSVNCQVASSYCSDQFYSQYHRIPSQGNLDILVANCFDPNREPLDYFIRSGTGCSRPQLTGCIGVNCEDTLYQCGSVDLITTLNTCDSLQPLFEFSWNSSTFTNNNNYSSSDTQQVTVTVQSEDGCFQFSDSIYTIPVPIPNLPKISDDKGINTDTAAPTLVELCNPDMVTFTATETYGLSYVWTGTGLPTTGVSTPDISTSADGTFTLTLTDTNGCDSYIDMEVEFFNPLPPFLLKMQTIDSVVVCEGDPAIIYLYDSIANPSGSFSCFTSITDYEVTTTWVDSSIHSYSMITNCETEAYIIADTTGWYHLSATVIRENACETDTHQIDTSIYITVIPVTSITPYTISISGSNWLCPNDTAILSVTGGPIYYWLGPNVLGNTNDSVQISQPGSYTVVSSISVIDSNGCGDAYTTFDSITVQLKPQPNISANELLICPNDSIKITCDVTGDNYLWEGPNGVITGDSIIYATAPGQYYCIVNDADSCGLVSNTITLTQYATPELVVSGSPVICDNDSLVISVVANSNSTINWLPPLSGSASSQTIYSPGIYTCEITSCGILSSKTIEVLPANPTADINLDSALCFEKTTTLSVISNDSTYQWWPTGDTTEVIEINSSGNYAIVVTDTNGCTGISDTLFVPEIKVESRILTSEDSVICFGESLLLSGPSGFNSYNWTPINSTDSSIIIDTAGTYTLWVEDSNGCSSTSLPYHVYMPDTTTQIDYTKKLLICTGDSTTFYPLDSTKINYLWYPTNSNDTSITFYQSTRNIQLTTIDSFGCKAKSITYDLVVEPNDVVAPTSTDTVTCAHELITLFASTPVGEISWYTEINGSRLEVGDSYTIVDPEQTTTYFIKSSRSVCSSEFIPVQLVVKDCDNLSAPNVFTPNGDGINDKLMFYIEEATCFKLTVFNRWGMKLYESEQMDEGWDGINQNNGKQVVNGTYYYIVEYCKYDNSTHAKTGYVSVVK